MRELTFQPNPDKAPLTALFERPRGARALYVFAHGAGAGMRHNFMESMSLGLAAEKIATLRFNFPYTEAGRRRPDHATTLKQTVRAAVNEGKRLSRGLPLFAGGKSMGGRTTSMLLSEAEVEAIRGVIFVGFPLHPPGKTDLKRALHLGDVQQPLLFLQGTRDKLAELELMRPLCKKLGRQATLHIVDGADHSFDVLKRSGRTAGDVQRELCTTIADWVTRVVG